MALHSFLTASAWRVVARPVTLLGGALLTFGALLAGPASRPAPATRTPSAYRLSLETRSDPVCTYGSAWNEGDVFLSHDASDGRVVSLTSRYEYKDGCTWEAVETLTPRGHGYIYDYRERHVACRAGARPGVACVRRGSVTVTAE